MAQQAPPARRDLFLGLPFEIKSRIVDFLDIEDVHSLRLTSRVWATKCEDRIWSNGITLLPNRNQMQKLIEIYSRPRLAEKIQHMTISLDDLDYPFLLNVGQSAIEKLPLSSFTSYPCVLVSLSLVIVSSKVVKVKILLASCLKKKS
jgi:hypothetical protein